MTRVEYVTPEGEQRRGWVAATRGGHVLVWAAGVEALVVEATRGPDGTKGPAWAVAVLDAMLPKEQP